MNLEVIYQWGVASEIAIGAIAFPLLFWITVPYGGRHTSDRWGPTLPSRLAWFLMEAPAPAFCVWAYTQGSRAGEPASLVLLAAFVFHYTHRSIFYPLRMRSNDKRTPLLSASVAMCVNVLNGTINGLALGHIQSYGVAWFADPRFWIGASLFVGGSAINLRADSILRHLRKPGETGYRIPEGSAYHWVSSPNYLGEIIQWAGWALATWSGAGVAFLVLTIANLAPRARANHRWYHATFPDYPSRRRNLIPFVW